MQIKSKIVGILNLSPDSFSDGKNYTKEELVEKINYLSDSGANIIDVGAESTAPGSVAISIEKELKRLEIFFEIIKYFPGITFSLDTMKSGVAKIGIQKGITMINDVSGGRFDDKMFELIAQNQEIKYVMMYSKNNSGRADLIENTDKTQILEKITNFFESNLKKAYNLGINKSQIIMDLGMGAFLSTDYRDSVSVLQNINKFKKNFGLAIFIGTSRKGFLSKLSKDNGVKDRLGSSIASSIFACQNGADYIRVHDVREISQFIECFNNLCIQN